MSEKVRTFIAVEIPGEVKDRARQLIARLSATPANVKWVGPEAMHWTLKFLGDVDMLEVPDICAAVERACRPFVPFDVEAKGAGAFPDEKRPRTVWIGVGQGSEPMIALHDAIERELSQLGYREENRRFRPHLTIGRVRNSPEGIDQLAGVIAANTDFESGLSTVYEVVIFSSTLGPKGPTHEPLGHAELRGDSIA